MRRISDGVKSSGALQDHRTGRARPCRGREFQYLYQDGDGYHFMNMENYDQVAVPADIVGDQAAYLQPEMKVHLVDLRRRRPSASSCRRA